MAEVIRSAAQAKAPPASGEEITEALKNVMASLAQRHGDSIRFITHNKDAKNDVAKSCALNLDFFQTVHRLPEKMIAQRYCDSCLPS